MLNFTINIINWFFYNVCSFSCLFYFFMKSKAKAGYMGSNLKYRRFKRSKLHFRLLSFGSRRHLFHLVNPSP